MSAYKLLVNPHINNPSIVRHAIFGQNGRFDLVAPVNFNDAMIVSQNKQELVVEVVGVDTHFGET